VGLAEGAEHRRVDSLGDYSAYNAAALAAEHGLPGPDLGGARRSVDKAAARRAYAGADIPQPEHCVAYTLAEARAAAEEVGYPVVVKPTDNRGCFGVRVATSADDLPACYFEALENGRNRAVLLEARVEGTHVTVDGYFFAGVGHRTLAIAVKEILPGDRPIIRQVCYPGDLPAAHRDRLLEVHERAVAALGVTWGPTHGEYIIEADGTPKVLEIASRGGGVLTFPVIVPAHTGLDMVGRLVADAGGDTSGAEAPADHLPEPEAAVVLDFFGFEGEGVIRTYEGLDQARAMPDVLAIRPMVSPGEPLLPPVNGAKRHAFCIARGADLAAARAAAQAAEATIRVDLEPAS
jgi:biotin carboxylase